VPVNLDDLRRDLGIGKDATAVEIVTRVIAELPPKLPAQGMSGMDKLYEEVSSRLQQAGWTLMGIARDAAQFLNVRGEVVAVPTRLDEMRAGVRLSRAEAAKETLNWLTLDKELRSSVGELSEQLPASSLEVVKRAAFVTETMDWQRLGKVSRTEAEKSQTAEVSVSPSPPAARQARRASRGLGL
jgi:hypothetical protein